MIVHAWDIIVVHGYWMHVGYTLGIECTVIRLVSVVILTKIHLYVTALPEYVVPT